MSKKETQKKEVLKQDFSKPRVAENLRHNFDVLKSEASELCEKQKKLQIKIMGNDWIKFFCDEKYDLPAIAFLSEIGELIESLPFKWWTEQEFDRENALMELVDMFHFWLIDLIVSESEDKLYFLNNPPESIYHIKRTIWKEILSLTDKALRPKTRETISGFLVHMSAIIDLLGYKAEDFINLYHAKNNLNSERQDKGYKDDKTKKLIDGEEDNKVLLEEVLKKMKEVKSDEEDN